MNCRREGNMQCEIILRFLKGRIFSLFVELLMSQSHLKYINDKKKLLYVMNTISEVKLGRTYCRES